VGSWVEKSLVMLEIFRCVWGVVELMLQKIEERKWGERQVGNKKSRICLIFLCELASEGKCLSFRGCTQSVNKNEKFLLNYISVEIYDRKSVLLDCCVVVSVDLWVVEDQGEWGSQIEVWRCWAVNKWRIEPESINVRVHRR